MDRLQEVLGDSLDVARGLRARGDAVVGVIGWGVPTELVEASGATMLRLLPQLGRPTPQADSLVGRGEAEETRALLEPVLDGSLAFCSLLVVTRSHEWVYYFVKEAVRTGAGGDGSIPPLHLLDFVASSAESLRAYNAEQLTRLAAVLARVVGHELDSTGWERAIASSNQRRALFRRVAELRRAGAISGANAVRLGSASATYPAAHFVELAERWLAERQPPGGQARLLLLASSDDPDGAIHEAIEAAGAIIVAEDGEWGVRTAAPDLHSRGESYGLLADALLDSATGPSVSPRERRVGWALRAIERDDIDAVVFAIPPSDHHFGWDYPSLRDRAESLGLPQLLVRADARRDPAAVTEMASQFIATLNKDAAA